jgi:hypothetical protein
MELVDEAMLARSQGYPATAGSLTRQAFEKECAAANRVAGMLDLEPTRSVLHRSAATLALECGEHGVAEQLIARALGGEPPDDVARELLKLVGRAEPVP